MTNYLKANNNSNDSIFLFKDYRNQKVVAYV